MEKVQHCEKDTRQSKTVTQQVNSKSYNFMFNIKRLKWFHYYNWLLWLVLFSVDRSPSALASPIHLALQRISTITFATLHYDLSGSLSKDIPNMHVIWVILLNL